MEGGFDLAEVVPQCLFKVTDSCLGGGAGEAVFDFVAYPVRRRVFKLADIEASVMIQLVDYRFRGNHPAFFVSPYMIEKGDGIHDNPGPGVPGQPLVVPDLEVGIPVQE